MSTFPKICNHSWSCRTNILESAIFHKMSCCKFLWGNPCKAIETFYHWDFVLWDSGFSMICCMKEFGDGFDGVTFSTLIDIVAETANVSSTTLSVGLTLPTIFKNYLSTLFCSLILDHDISSINSISGAKILISYILLDTSFDHRFQSLIIRSCFLLMNLQVILVVLFQYCFEFFRLPGYRHFETW